MITYKSPRRGEYTISAPRTIFRNPCVCIIINRALLPSNGAFEGRSTIPSCFIGWLKIALCEYKGGNNPRMFTREFIDRTYSETSAQNPPITITSISRSINILKFCPKRGYFETLWFRRFFYILNRFSHCAHRLCAFTPKTIPRIAIIIPKYPIAYKRLPTVLPIL